ncbi:hypothetical protein SAY87_000831 [Trapa incisa]|uniref:Uncharacterized protein n=1 Tax=Trapa incisa TaxID=236973 RepID=A0AAN7GHK0_9MYRT|nr:hypothetical protein SAY87_000831 [Trapa incisa]
MEEIHKFLNIAAPIFTFFSILLHPPASVRIQVPLLCPLYLLGEDVADKVVLFIGASSGIGEHLAYEYARRGACLASTARRQASLHEVADMAMELGAPEAIVIHADASKAALLSMFETLRVELGLEIGITIVTPGFMESKITQGKHMTQDGQMEVDRRLRDVKVEIFPVAAVEGCARLIVDGPAGGQVHDCAELVQEHLPVEGVLPRGD